MEMFQPMSMSSNTKNKLQLCSVNQCQCGRRQIWVIFSQIQPVHSLFVTDKKMSCLTV